jgi:hypothetical protein
MLEEEIFGRQRSHENWLMKCDGNNEFFHCIANGRKRKNNILSLEDDGRKTIGDELLEYAPQYYVNLFGPAPFNMF